MVVDIIILSPNEEFITWLDSTTVNIEETSQSRTIREINIEHPLTENTKLKKWYHQGNKIWISGGNGLIPCLYVINQEYKINHWKKETVSLTAEEVLVELNNVELYSYTGSTEIKINREFLENVYGEYYTIGEIDTFVNNQNNKILPVGTMTLIELLRLIESETGMIFTTEYKKADDSNTIKRHLNLKQEESIGINYSQPLIIGYNCDNVEVDVDETDTYRAIAPILTLSETGNSTTGTSSLTKKDLANIISNYKSLSIKKGDKIPMIIEKEEQTDTSGNTKEKEVITAYWYAPFNKKSGNLYVEDDAGEYSNYNTTEANYNQIYSKKDSTSVKTVPKMGNVSTSEQNKYAIYNACARALLEKRYPDVEINVSVADLNLIMGKGNSYNIYDSLFVKVPGYNKPIQAYITKTVKNPYDFGSNKITVSNAKIGTKVTQQDTSIKMKDTTISKKGQLLNGTLLCEGSPLPNEVVSISFKMYTEEKTPEITDTGNSGSKNKAKAKTKTVTERIKRTDVITCYGYPTCSCCGYPKNPYKKVRRTYLNKCPNCGKKMTLLNNPKHVVDGEITCSKKKGGCDADYCVFCGGDKWGNNKCKRYKLTKATEYTTVTRKVAVSPSNTKSSKKTKTNPKDPTDNKTAKKNIKKYGISSKIVKQARTIAWGKTTDQAKMRAIANWMGLGNNGHIKYERYDCTRRGAEKTLKARKGNCADQSHLCIAFARCMGVKCRYVHRYNHFYGEYYWNGNWHIIDTTTSIGWGHYWRGAGYLISKGQKLNC